MNKVYDGLYNEETKQRFLKTLHPNTQMSYIRVLLAAKRTEEQLGKDLYDFNLNEIEYVLYDLAPTTVTSSEVSGRIITSYITWAIEQGLRSNNINPLKLVSSDYFKKFVDPSIVTFLSEKELIQIEEGCVNAQDAAIFRLLFEGVGGTTYSEIRNLKREDIDEDNRILKLVDEDGKTRELQVEQRTIDLVLKAAKEEIYYKKNGEVEDESGRIRQYTDLVKNDYVFRPSITKVNSANMPIEGSVIYRRVSLIKDFFDIPYLTPKNVAKSGMLKMAKDFVESEGELKRHHYIAIAERFKVNNWYSLKKYITIENINRVYGE